MRWKDQRVVPFELDRARTDDMELDDHAFLNELLAMRREPWDLSLPAVVGDHFYGDGGGCFDCCFEESGSICPGAEGGFAPLPNVTTATYANAVETLAPSFGCFNPAVICPTAPISLGSRFLPAVLPEVQSSCSTSTTSTPGGAFNPLTSPSKDLEPEELSLVHGVHGREGSRGITGRVRGDTPVVCKAEELNQTSSIEGSGAVDGNSVMGVTPVPFDMGSSSPGPQVGKARAKKIDGQPSKNLMAERRRRKRLNDRLSMLRSVVPKISKMDRTSILGDTIDYMRELLDRIHSLREEMAGHGDGSCPSPERPPAAGLLRILKDRLSYDEALIRNTPRFNVERRETDTRVEMSCAARAGLLLSTVNTLEVLGLEIRQCVVSCFNDFGMHASCSEGAKQRDLISPEEIKQALFRNAGYGGRCV